MDKSAETGGERDDKAAGKEASDALRSLLQRIGEIFGVFDLSFFVAGAVCLAAVLFGVNVFRGEAWIERIKPAGQPFQTVHFGALILGCYVLGMVCFALGAVRRQQGAPPYAGLRRRLEETGLDARYAHLLDQPPGFAYTRLWAELRQRRDLAPSCNLITRYWVMAAMCDGLAVAWLVWALTWAAWAHVPPDLCEPGPSYPIKVVVAAAFVAASLLCWREASRYGAAQVQELLATLAFAHEVSEPGKADGRR